MASTPRYAVSSDNENHHESSPDPLAASFDENLVRAARRPTKQQPLAATSSSKQNRRPAMADFELSSPTKQMLLSTPRTGGQSPWRIKVTVQAEPGSDSENIDSPSMKHLTTTKTTKIPLKDADASSPVKRRGRPRKSDAPTKRSGTPVRKRAASKARQSSAGDTSAADVETDGTPRRRRGRPRKAQAPAEDDIWGQAHDEGLGADSNAADVETDATPKKRRGRPRKSIQPTEHSEPTAAMSSALDQTELDTPLDTTTETHVERTVPLALPNQSSPTTAAALPTLQDRTTGLEATPVQTETSRRLKARKNTPVAQDMGIIEISSAAESEDSDEDLQPSTDTDQHEYFHQDEQVQHLQGPAIEFEDVDGEQHDETHFAFEEGATRMPDDTTVIDSENFSMISVDSLPSCASVTRPSNGVAENTPVAHAAIPVRDHEKLSMPSANLRRGARSSPAPTHINLPLPQDPRSAPPRYKTPSVEPVELPMPPPVQPARPDPSEAQTPRIGRVVKAGVALQGLLDPNRNTPESGSSKTLDERRDHLDDLFRGFSERTRRELHAGLRLGEQLAQQAPSSPAMSSPIKVLNYGLSAPLHTVQENMQNQRRLPTPEDGDDNVSPTVAEAATEVEYPTLAQSDRSGLLSPISNPEEGDNASEMANHSHETGAPVVQEALDLWQEEASRSSPADPSSHVEGLFSQDGPVKPVRGKLPRTWRRRAADKSQCNGEREVSQTATPPTTESNGSIEASVQDTGKSKQMAQTSSEEDESEASDDTGSFFVANMPNLYGQKRPGEFRRGRAQHSEISLHLDESLLSESSSPAASKTPMGEKPNPFLDTPPQLAALRSSPGKSSPLRQEIHSSDLSSEMSHYSFEESTLPLAPSSPFHTVVDGDVENSMASDQRQFLNEMAGPDSSVCRIRDEADDYLEAYEPQARELEDLTEMTEPSRTWHRDTTMVTSSPPKSLFSQATRGSNLPRGGTPPVTSSSSTPQIQSNAASTPTPAAAPAPTTSRTTDKPATHLPPTPSSPSIMEQPTQLHPALQKLPLLPLPRVEPWTKTHYKTLDRLYQFYKKRPHHFSPTSGPNAALNATLLTEFLAASHRPFVGAKYRAWGYNVVFTEALIVMCAAYVQLLSLDSVAAYEAVAGKEIEMGDCAPGKEGTTLGVEIVAERLATIVLGEAVRRDEKLGKSVDKTGRLRIEWPA